MKKKSWDWFLALVLHPKLFSFKAARAGCERICFERRIAREKVYNYPKNPPARIICLLLLSGWLTCPNPAAAQSPTIIAGPTNQVVAVGGTVTLGVTAGGPAPAYQWFKDSRLILGATNSTLTVTNAGVANSGTYSVVVTNGSGMVISLPASVAVGNPSLLAWGYNGDGELGNGTTTEAHTPISVASNVVAGAAGGHHSLFIKTDGTLWAMGDNFYGQLGNGTTTDAHTPISVASNVMAVAAGRWHSLFVKTNGTLWAMGGNYYGGLGNGTTTDAHTPISVASNVVAAAAGWYHSLFVKTDGTLWAMGENGVGELGNGTTSNTNRPISVASNVVAVAAGADHSLFVKTDGTLWAMGYNSYGQLGNGTTSNTNRPVNVASNVVAVAAGADHSLFVKTDGTLWAMGYNSYGQLGNGTTTDAHTPISVASNVVAVAAGAYHSLFVKNDGTLRAMGDNANGQLGNDTTSSTNLPVIVPQLSVANIFPSVLALRSLALGMNSNATVTLGNLTQTYTGGAISVTASTTPPGLTVNLTYNGSLFAPTNVGSYTVIGTVSDPTYFGSATNTLVINPAPATVTLSNLNQYYTGGAISVTASTIPPGLTVNLTYNGSPFAPTNVGSYTVIGTVSDPNYVGSATSTLVINPNATVTLSNLNQYYTGGAINVTVSTVPPGLTVNLTYNGSPFAPTNVGSYTVIGTVSTPNYAGGATNTLVINPNATVTLGNLTQTYTGSAISVSVSTVPPGLTVNLTYNGSPFAPTNVGSYTVVGTVSTPNYAGSATNTLFIMPSNGVSVCSEADLRAAVSNGGMIIFACDGTLSLSNEITVNVDAILDATVHAVVLSGRGSNRLFRINAGRTLTLINLTLRDGLAAGTNGVSWQDSGGEGVGGAILNQGGVLNAISCSFLANTAQGGQGGGAGGNAFGGAVVNQGGWVGLTNSVFEQNNAAGGYGGNSPGLGGSSFGGAVYSDGGAVVADNCSFQTNRSAAGRGATSFMASPGGDASGGAIFNTNSTLKLIRTALSGNTALGYTYSRQANGGAVYHDTGTFEAVDCLFQMNSANGGSGTDWYRGQPPGDGKGGALWISVASSDISGCSFVSNSAVAGMCLTLYESWCGAGDAAGGAIYNRQTLASENSTFYGDNAIYIYYDQFSGLSYVYPKPGGAIYNDGGSGVLTHVTKVSGVVSAAITSSTNGSITLRNCILTCTNSGGNGGGNLIDGGGNISSDGTPAFTEPTSHNNLDPQLGTLSYQGGPTPTVSPLPGSPAIAAASSQWCLATDQRGYPRPCGAGCDIGAVEYWPSNSVFGRISGYTTSPGGITMSSGAISATVRTDGVYGLPGLPAGASVVAPQCSNAIFVPSNRTVNLPPDAMSVDFYSYRSNALMILRGSNNTMQILFAGEPSGTYRVLVSSNLSIWFPFATNTLTSDGLLQFVETNQPSFVERFFRAVRP